MVYSSVIFIFYFLPLLLAGYYLLPRTWAKNTLLFLASLSFYAFGAGSLFILLLGVGISAWLFSYLIVKTGYKRLFISLAVIVYVGILVYYKYLGFIIDNLIYSGIRVTPMLKIVMPAGLSFFIFQAISYNIDAYRKNSRYEKNPIYVILFICMFPQLISGPLVRYHQIQEQLKSRKFDFAVFAEGVRRFVIGFAKKVLIADQLNVLVTQVMNTDIKLVGPAVAWTGIIAFTLQIFFDFSGYTDMAIGVGKMLGFELPENFNFPYISRSISEFWRRWHMTLSAWLRDYIFMPLSLSMRRWGKSGVFISLMVTFTICGMWHGATWNFIIWGAIQGLFMVLEQLFLEKYLSRFKVGSIVYTLMIVMTGFVFVRTTDISQAYHYLKAMFTPGDITPIGLNAFLTNQFKILILLGVLFSIPIKFPKKLHTKGVEHVKQWTAAVLLILLFIFSVMTVVTESYNPFIYFRF
ncbi:MAG: MBOAT family O-acyltransferase [Bacteroidales bacterium]